jgi:tetrapyrrole methylase family protein/MazG family protein
VQELKDALQEKNPTHIEEVAGDVLFVLVNLFRRHCIEPECALHRANSKFRRRFSYVEDKVKESGKSWQMFTLLELNDFWKEAKEIEGRSSTV